MVEFTDKDYEIMEKRAKELLGWDFKEKFGMSIKEMIENPEKGKERLIAAKHKVGLIDRVKISKILSYLEDPNWKAVLKSKLS